MDINQFAELLQKKLPNDMIFRDEPMKNYTTFRIGGKADLLVKPKTYQQIAEIITLCKKYEVPYYVLGNGSNLLVSDEGYRGVIIHVYNQLADIKVEGNRIIAGAGAILSKVATVAMENSLTGLEFAHGIPGTLGGAVVMNAGAYNGEMKNVLISCEVMDEEGKVITLSKDELQLGYRTSIIQNKNYIVLRATMQLEKGEKENIKAYMKELMLRRKEKQPLDKPSAGSTFKRPEGYFAGKLIMDSGLKGYQIGGAKVSEKHCGFIINTGNATCQDVVDLIRHIQKEVKRQFNVELKTEVKRLKNNR